MTTQEEDRLREALAKLGVAAQACRKRLRAVNNPEDATPIALALEAIDNMLGANAQDFSPNLAGDLDSLRKQLTAFDPPPTRDDGDLFDPLQQAVAAVGLLSMALDRAAVAAAQAGHIVAKSNLPMLDSASAPRLLFEARARAVERRLDEIADLLRERIEPEGEALQGRSIQQIGVVNVYVKDMKVETAIAKLAISTKELVNIEALARAVENIALLTRQFGETLRVIAQRVTPGLREAGEAIRRPVRMLVTGVKGVVRRASGSRDDGLKPGDEFREDPNGPVMLVIPAGSFLMGSPEGEGGDHERPQHEVTFARPFAIGKYAVTVDEFAAFVADTGHDTGTSAFAWDGSDWKKAEGRSWRDPGFPQTGRHPVTCVNWDDARAYAAWLSRKTGQRYRLPSESEWEYAARAGTKGAYWTGETISPNQANFDGKNKGTVPVDSYAANPFGLYNVHGNVWEWVEDCWNDSYEGAPVDGSAWTTGDSSRRVLRGGSWSIVPEFLRAPVRLRYYPVDRNSDAGFRLARTLNP